MKFRKIEWIKNTATYATGYSAKIGKLTIGHTSWNSCRRKEEEEEEEKKNWNACTNMIGIKERLGSFKTEKEAMKIIEKAYKYWQRLLTEK